MKNSTLRLVLLLVLSAVCTLVATSCNTVRGIGKDVNRAGTRIENAAR